MNITIYTPIFIFSTLHRLPVIKNDTVRELKSFQEEYETFIKFYQKTLQPFGKRSIKVVRLGRGMSELISTKVRIEK